MTKKATKIILCIIGILTIICSIFYLLNRSKKKDNFTTDEETPWNEDELFEEEEEALDLSTLKFSRHYVDLR